MLESLASLRVDGLSIWVILPLCGAVFLASVIDAIAGGGGIISLPSYLIAFGNKIPVPYALGTNKFSAAAGTFLSAARFVKNGYVNWRLFSPAVVFALVGSAAGTWLQHRTPDAVLKYLLLLILPVVAIITLRSREWPDEPGEIDPRRQMWVICASALLVGTYDGYYGPGTGTFLMILFVRFAKLDTRHAAGGVKLINLSSNIGSLAAQLASNYVFLGVGFFTALASVAGHYIGSGLAIKNGGKIIRPMVAAVLVLLTLKVGSELLFPELWG